MPNGILPQGGPDVRGGNDPARSALLSKIRQGGGVPRQGQAAIAPQGQPGQAGQTNEVAFHLSRAFEALTRTGPTEENLAALQGFIAQIQQLAPPEAAEQQAPIAQAPGPLPPAGGGQFPQAPAI